MNFLQNVQIWQDTALRAPYYPASYSVKVALNRSYVPTRSEKTIIKVLDQDSLVAERQAVQEGARRPLVLNFADNLFPGGDVRNGSGAQEESLWRRTNLCITQAQQFYPLLDEEGVYTAVATVLKDVNGVLLPNPWFSSFVAVPGLRNPTLTDNHLSLTDLDILRNKVRLICQVGAQYNHDALVLGPLGCGAWKNPPQDVAKVFREVLLREYKGVFRLVLFACLRVPDSHYLVRRRGQADSYDAFKTAFALDADA